MTNRPTGSGFVSESALSIALGPKAPLDSPAFTGNPTAPTPTAGDNDTSIATTAFVSAALAIIGNGTTAVDKYGAIGDGTTDDLAAINTAIAALPNGGTLVFTPGKTYLTSATIEVANKNNITIVLSGATLTTTGTTDTSAVLRVLNCAGAQITGGYLFHKNTGSRKNAADGLTVQHSSNVLVQGVNVGYTYSMGIRAAGSNRVTIVGCTVNGTLADGIGAYGAERYSVAGDGAMTASSAVLTSASCMFQAHDVGSKITVPGAAASGADLVTTILSRQSASQVTLATAASTTVAGKFPKIQRAATDVSIIGNHLVNTGDDAISSVGYLTYPNPNTDIVVLGNTITGSLARGILMCGTSRSAIIGNTTRGSAMAGIYGVVEVGSVTSWGVTDMLVQGNVVESANSDFPTDNYPAIGASSIDDNYPVLGLIIAGNEIRSPNSYYVEVGGYGGSNTAASCREITIKDNVLLGGNANNPAIYTLRCTNITVAGNRVSRARTSAIAIDSNCAGFAIVRDNITSNHDRIGSGYGALDIGTGATAIVYNNVVNNVLIASGTSGGGANPGGTAP